VGGGSLGLQTNLGSFFSLDNTLADATGNVTALTNNNAVTFVSPPGGGLPAVTNCGNFVLASSQYLSHADATGLNIVGVDYSIQAWFYTTSSSQTVVSKRTGGFGNREYGINYTFGTGSSNPVQIQNGDYTAIASSNVANSAWTHVVFTFNNTSKAAILYVNGSSAATATQSGTGPGGTSNFYIGADPTPGVFMNGNIALVGVWRSRILSAGDVTLLYNSGAGLSYAAMA
jgi:hypothetical protein